MRGSVPALVLVLGLVAAAGCAHRGPLPVATRPGLEERGLASWYGEPYHGRRTASGEVYDMYALTAAHRTLPFGTRVRVVRRDTGAAVEVRVNDRGPFVRGRIIDLSYAAARTIGLDVDGVAPVVVSVLGPEPPAATTSSSGGRPAAATTTSEACLWVQVGAFAEARNAHRARRRLERHGEPVVVAEGPRGLLRVRVGPFAAAAEAEAAADRLRADWPAAALVGCGG